MKYFYTCIVTIADFACLVMYSVEQNQLVYYTDLLLQHRCWLRALFHTSLSFICCKWKFTVAKSDIRFMFLVEDPLHNVLPPVTITQ